MLAPLRAQRLRELALAFLTTILRTISRSRQLALGAGDDPKQNAAQRQSIDHIGHHAEAIKQSDKKVNAEIGAGKGY